MKNKLSKLEQLLKDTNTKQEFNIVEDLHCPMELLSQESLERN